MVRLRELRLERKLTQSQLAEQLHTNYQTISDYERGKYFPDLAMLRLLAAFFNTSIDFLLGLTDLRDPYQQASEQHFTLIEVELIELFRTLDDTQKGRLLGLAQGLLEANSLHSQE